MTARLVLVRHGRTAWNVAARFQGQSDPPLDAIGRAQARRAAAALRWRGLVPTHLLSSDLRRARDTALVVARVCGLSPSAAVADPALREVDLGTWEGLDHEEARRRHPDEYEAWCGEAGVADLRRGGGETCREAGARAADALVAALATWGAGGTVVAVSHGLALQAAMADLAARGVVRLNGDAPHLGNGEWIELEVAAAPLAREPARLER